MTFPALPRTWSLDGFSFNIGADANGHTTIVDIPEWENPPGPKPKISPRTEGDGSYRGPNYLDGQSFRIKGTGQAMTPQSRILLRDRLAALCLDPGTLYPLTCSDPARAQDLTVYVERDDQPDIRWSIDGISLTFDIPLYAADPLKYSPDNAIQSTALASPGTDGILWNGSPGASGGIEWNGSPTVSGGLIYQSGSGSSGVLRLTNNGTKEAPILYTITGTVTNPRLSRVPQPSRGLGNAIVRWGGTVNAPSQLIIDTKTERVTLDSVDVNGALTNSDFFGVPGRDSSGAPGYVDIEYTATSGSGTMLFAVNKNVYV